ATPVAAAPLAATPPVHAPIPTPAAAHSTASIDAAATAAVAAALAQEMAFDDVTIRPTPPKPTLFVEPAAPQPVAPQQNYGNFIPPHPERVPQRPRMPRIDELPPQAQREIHAAQRGELGSPEPEKQRMSLLKRLASAGLGLKQETEEPEMRQEPRHMLAPPMPPRMPQRPPSRPAGDPVSEYARRAPQAPQGLDMHGRQAPVNNSSEDDQLEIPAFLRRQAN
ncbi:MAG: cell division protein FtsZ, partial [Pseudorhodoplanes sp.]